MRKVRSKNTGPEMRVRHVLTRLGYRYRLHRKDLPGNPDLAFIGRRKAIFVHGCFWHGHDCKRGARTPKTNRAYWTAKIDRNRARDTLALARYEDMGWRALTIYECELSDGAALEERLTAFLGPA